MTAQQASCVSSGGFGSFKVIEPVEMTSFKVIEPVEMTPMLAPAFAVLN